MSRVVFMCGPAGSGKSTWARRLEDEGFIRLSIDEEAWIRGYKSHPLSASIARAIEDHLRNHLVSYVNAGRDVVLDFSFWSRAMRNDYRHLLIGLGVTPVTVYLATPRNVVLERMRARSGTAPNEVKLSEETAAEYFDTFEPPTAEEGPLHIIR
ncbi:hypothetical protein BJ994_000430 [Arthrobacter pigmenti]|uniref:ATP-binding protein n=1 Tax=Arthrobacter pigmenti TaxID=271432 RepID=A0A846RM27_9MICC|nr:hypothetical protein [Arthrobacter pigmenti]